MKNGKVTGKTVEEVKYQLQMISYEMEYQIAVTLKNRFL